MRSGVKRYEVLEYVRAHPGCSGAEVSAALRVNASTFLGPLYAKRLIRRAGDMHGYQSYRYYPEPEN